MNSHYLFRSKIDRKRLNIPNLEIRTHTLTKNIYEAELERSKFLKKSILIAFLTLYVMYCSQIEFCYPSRSASVYSIIKLVKFYVTKEKFIFYFQPLIKGLFNYLHEFYMCAITKEYLSALLLIVFRVLSFFY